MARLLLALVLAVAGLSTGTATAETLPRNAVTVRVDPSYQQPEFEGWGTSLVWFANITGGYPEPIRRKLVDLLFGEEGLRLNIARYNIGGGNAPDVRKDYMKVGATMEGFWQAPPGTTRADVDWWRPDNPAHWNFAADANQRWWVDQIKRKITRWEAFSNSPPWFQTVSGYVSGGFDANTDQIRPDRVDDFATYLARVTQELERSHGIEFDTLAPLNEPNTNYWGTQLGPDGQPTGGRQEGAHAGPALQQEVLLATRRALDRLSSRVKVSAMDETNPGTFVRNWNGYGPAREVVDQLNVHTYGTGQRTSVRDIAKGAGEKLWMSEVEGTWGNGTTDYTGMEPGLGMATRMLEDIRELEPSAWVFWQPVEDSIPQQAAGKNWGSVHIPFNCTAADTLESCPIRTNTKFHTIRNFTHFVRPGDRFVKTDDPSTVAAVKRFGHGASVVHVNNGTAARSVTLDLSRFRDVSGTVTPVVTSTGGALVRGKPVRFTDGSATLAVPGKSVTTFVVDGVSGVARDAALVQPGHVYRLGQSGKSLQPSDDWTRAVARPADVTSGRQLWSVRKLGHGNGNRERYELVNAVSGTRLAASGDAVVLQSAGGTAAQWIMSTTGDGTWTFVNAATGALIDATGETVAARTPTSGTSQRWSVTDETVLRTREAAVFTVPKLSPVLPHTVTPVFRDGPRDALPVVWELPPDSRWSRPGTVRVHGTATDALGRKLPALAVVTVDTIGSTIPAAARTYVGGQPDLPATVTGVGTRGGRAELPVTWDAAVFDRVGTVTVTGRARIVDGSTVAATAVVEVTEPVEVNAAPDPAVTVAATYTESGYSAERLRNNVTDEKAWSNWRSGTKNPADTITFTFPKARDLTKIAVHSYRDGDGGIAKSLKVQVRAADGTWADASGDVEVTGVRTDVVLNPSPATTAVRVVLTARPSGYLTLAEVEVFAKSAA